MSWTNNLIEYHKNKKVLPCPKCNSNKVKIEELEHDKRKSITFSCDECGSFNHFDGKKNN